MSSSPSPKKRPAHWSPNRKERDEDDFSDMPVFVPRTYVVEGVKTRYFVPETFHVHFNRLKVIRNLLCVLQ